jgi:hypothetical protein
MHRGILETVFFAGVHGSAENLKQWVEMYRKLASQPLPQNLSEYQQALDKQVNPIRGFETVQLTDDFLQKEVIRLFDAGATEVILPYSELRWRKQADWVFHSENEESFFVANELNLSPLQYIRSRVQNFCESKGMIDSHRDEVVISVTEAAENAIKYSNVLPVLYSPRP